MRVANFFLCFVSLFILAPASHAALKIGDVAPAVSAEDTHGKAVNLAEMKGKIVVLEWTNHACPFVRKHYDSKNIQTLQSYSKEKDVVWISVISSAQGKQGFVTAEEANKIVAAEESHAAHIVLDPSGAIGKAYDAKTTPHMFVIDKQGKLAYMGAIDDVSSADVKDVARATNYVRAAMDDLMAGKTPKVEASSPYGCGIKY